MLKNTRSIFSTSTAAVNPSGRSDVTASLMSRLRAMATNASVHSTKRRPMGDSVRLSDRRPFSYLRKSSIWFISRRSILTFLSAIFISVFWRGVRLSAAASCSTGSAMRVSGVRRSCETLVKKISFDCVASASCSLRAFCASRCSSSRRFCSIS